MSLSAVPLSTLLFYSVAYADLETTIHIYTAVGGGGSTKMGVVKTAALIPTASFMLHNQEADPEKLLVVLR